MRRWHITLLGIVLSLGLCFSGPVAEAATVAAEPAVTAHDADRLPIYPRDEWQFIVAPYLWIPGANSTISSLRSETSINLPWWEVVSRLFSNAIGAMGRVEARKGRWGLYVDGYFLYLQDSGSGVGATRSKNFGPVDVTIDNTPGKVSGNISLTPSGDIKMITRIGSLDVGGRYLVGIWPMEAGKRFPVCSMEMLGGLRWNSFNQYLKINLRNARVGNINVDVNGLSLSASQQSINNGSYTLDFTLNVVEPFIGTRIGFWLSPKWLFTMKGDVGGFGVVAYNDVSCNLECKLGYRINQALYAYAGYKARGSWFNLDGGLGKISYAGWLHGPVLGAAYQF